VNSSDCEHSQHVTEKSNPIIRFLIHARSARGCGCMCF